MQKPISGHFGNSDTSGDTKYRNSEYLVVAPSKLRRGIDLVFPRSKYTGCYGLYIKVFDV